MKKVLSVALASAMVLGMGANAFAISYSTGSNNEADWPKDFQFDGELFVTNKDGDIVEEASTRLNDSEAVDFEPGDTIWMPLFAKDQTVYGYEYKDGTDGTEDRENVKVKATIKVELQTSNAFKNDAGKWTENADDTVDGNEGTDLSKKGYYYVANGKTFKADKGAEVDADEYDAYDAYKVTVSGDEVENESARYYIAGTRYKTIEAFKQALAEQGNADDAYVTIDVEGTDEVEDSISKPYDTDTVKGYYNYTGNIDKNWSINLIEKSEGVAELIDSARLYKATAADVQSYKDYADDIVVNGVYLQVKLKDTWKTVDKETLTYYVYIADNESGEQTNEVWVSGTYANNDWEYVNFDWTNDASVAKLWKVKKGENGTAVFDFADKAFFTVKMYSGESMYLDLSTAYDKAIAGEMDAEADSFYKFDNDNANFSRTGELIIVTNDSSLVPYEIDEDGNFVEVDAKYVEDYAIAHTNKKVDGFVFSTKTLGNYVLSTEELGQEEEVNETPAEPVTPSEPTTETPAPETSKPNPETGAEDFVGLAVSLAVVSVAAAGALALKK